MTALVADTPLAGAARPASRLPAWYDAPENRPFYLVLVVVPVGVCALMAFGLRRRSR